ncbi:MAG: hypothetical protein DMG92_11205 [Acidobacteria bacterium]|nr:MAG: hypothetical protein DMG92_11205 [Acidobacteriota bacterium]
MKLRMNSTTRSVLIPTTRTREYRAHNNLGLVQLQSGDLRSAQAEFLEALRLKSGYAEAHYNLALTLRQEGKMAESNAEFEKAYAISPELKDLPR